MAVVEGVELGLIVMGQAEVLAMLAAAAAGPQPERLLVQTPAVAEAVEELPLPRPRVAALEVLGS